MGDDKAQRLDDALSSLVDILIPVLPEEDEAAADERHDDALDLARNIIEGYLLHIKLAWVYLNSSPFIDMTVLPSYQTSIMLPT